MTSHRSSFNVIKVSDLHSSQSMECHDSLGCTIIEMATGQLPWTSRYDDGPKNGYPLMLHVANSNAAPYIPTGLPSECQDLIGLCLRRKPSARMTAQKLTTHKFFSVKDFKLTTARRLSQHIKAWDKERLSNYLQGIKRYYNNKRRMMLKECSFSAYGYNLYL